MNDEQPDGEYPDGLAPFRGLVWAVLFGLVIWTVLGLVWVWCA